MTELSAWIILLFPAAATLVLVVELAAAQLPVPRPPGADDPFRLVILVPAHDEAAVIAATAASLRRAAPAEARLLVIADNCRDETAALARAAGAEVIERDDPARRGKGFALDFARGRLAGDPPQVVIVIDADCSVAGDGIVRLAAVALATGRPVQSTYLMRPRPERGAMVGLSGLAFLIRNLVRQRGLARLGAPALLTGSGMALPWEAFAAAPLASADLVEDLGIGIALARAGRPAVFLPDARTWSEPARPGAALAQRARWEQGFLRTAAAQAFPLIASARWPQLWLGLHLLVPPLALLAILDAVALGLLAPMAALPFTILAVLVAAALLMLGLSWARFGREQISGGRLLLIPLYVIWKLPLYFAALARPERRWIRTERD